MSDATLKMLLLGEDVSAGRAMRKVGDEAEATGLKIRMAFREAAAGMGGPIGKSAAVADKSVTKMSHGTLMAAGVMVGAVGLIAVKTTEMASSFQKSMTLLETGAGESERNLAKVSNGILQMAGEVGFMPAELAKGMYLIESAGYHGAAGLKVLRAAAEGAKADGADLSTVGNALTTVMTDMHAPTAQAATVMSQMVVAVGLGKMRMDDLASSIHSVLPNAAAAGLSFAQVGGAIATMTAEGIGAEQASQNLNHTIVKLLSPTASMTSAMASYGLNADMVKRQLGKVGLTGTMEELSAAILKHMGPAGLTLRSAFNQSQAAAADARKEIAAMPPTVKALAEQYMKGKLSLGEWKKAVKALPTDQAALAAQFKASADRTHGFSDALKSGKSDAQTFSGAMKDMLGDQTGLQVALHLTGDHLSTFKANVKKIAGTTDEAGGHVRDWAKIQHNLSQQTDEAKASMTALGIGIGTDLLPVMSVFAHAASVAAGWLVKHKTLGEILIGVVGGLGVALLALAAATWAVNTAMDANIFVLIAAALVALGVALVIAYKKSETFRNIVNTAFRAVAAVVRVSMEAIRAVISTVLGWVRSFWAKWGGDIMAVVNRVFSAIRGYVSGYMNVIRGVIRVVMSALHGDWSGAWQGILQIFRGVWQMMKSVLSLAWAGIKAGVKVGIAAVVALMVKLPGMIVSAVGNLGGLLIGAGKSIIGGLISGVGSMVGSLISKLHSITSLIPLHKGPLDKDRQLLNPAGRAIMEGLIAGIQSREVPLKAALARVTGFVAAQNKAIASLSSSRASIISSVMGMGTSVMGQSFANQTTGAPGTLSDMLGFQMSQLRAAQQMRFDVNKARKMGLSQSLLGQFAAAGATGAANLHAIVTTGGRTDVAHLNALNAATMAAQQAAANATGNAIYGHAIRQATRERNQGLALERALQHMQVGGHVQVDLKLNGRFLQRELIALKRNNGGKPLGIA